MTTMITGSTIAISLVLAVTLFASLITAEASRYTEDTGSENSRHRHRHRHEGAASVTSSRRNHDFTAIGRGQSWPKQDAEYEEAFEADEDDEEEEDEDYELERSRTFHERGYQSARGVPRNHHPRYEPRYPLRHHRGPYGSDRRYRIGSSLPIEEDADRRRWHYDGSSRSQRSRQGRERSYHEDRRTSGSGYQSRNHDFGENDSAGEIATERDTGYERNQRRWRFDDEDEDDDPTDYRPSIWRNFGRHRSRFEGRRSDWKSRNSGSSLAGEDEDWLERRRKMGMIHRGGKRGRLPIDDENEDDLDILGTEKKGSWGGKRSKSGNTIDRGFGSVLDRKSDTEDPDYRDEEISANDEVAKKHEVRGEEDKDQEEEDVWKEAEEDPDDDEEDTFDHTNYYKTEDEPPYKTFDDIIKSLTSEDPTTSKPSIRRDYRNIGIEKFLKKDAYGNMYDSRNVTTTTMRNGHDTLWNGRSSTYSANRWRFNERKPDITNFSTLREGKKISNAIGDVNGSKGRKENEKKRVWTKQEDSLTRTKSLEQEYDDDYENNEKDEDAAKIGNVTEMQADINNAEYADEENETETEDETSAPLMTLALTSTAKATTTTTTPSTTTTTTTTTTTPRSTTARTAVMSHDRKDLKSYESVSHSNGLLQQQHQQQQQSQKWQALNTRDNSKDTKGHGQQQNTNKNGKSVEIKEALQHAIKVSREGSCQWPRARVIPVRDVYPSPSTTYIPHCAILHRCSDDTGCCRSEALTCVPKVSHRVELYFYTTSIEGASVVEKLSFYNHTECECKERDEYGTTVDKTSGTNENKLSRHQTQAVSPPQNIRRPPQRKPCRCPSEFTPRITPEGECQCSCSENRPNCIRTKRGKGYFSLRDRLCIQNEGCATPTCEFGEYMRRQGKCPRKKDKFDAIANHPSNINLHHRLRS